jgi:exopolyphosphatase/guanosine-5'-triphosphate,3'-diphosphate pyrophosphatase
VRCACIDIGSNTTRLLVAEPDRGALREVLAQRVFTRLRAVDGAIPHEKIGEVAAVVSSQVQLAREAGAGEVRAVATAAVRGAANGGELCAAVRDASGVDVAVLSGQDEARLAFLGATSTHDDVPEGLVAVVDVGGGSTEIVCGTAGGGVSWAQSFALGSGTLTDALVRSDPPTDDELAAIREAVRAMLAPVAPPPPLAAFAVGGSATSLRRLVGETLDHVALWGAITAVCTGPAAEIAERFDLHAERVRVLPAGMVVLDEAGALLGAPLRIACGGLREGVILDALREAC